MIFHFYFKSNDPLECAMYFWGKSWGWGSYSQKTLFAPSNDFFFQKKSQSHLFAQEVSFLVTLQSSSSPKKTKMSPACKRLKFRWPAALFWNTASSSVFFFPNDGPPRRKSPSFRRFIQKRIGGLTTWIEGSCWMNSKLNEYYSDDRKRESHCARVDPGPAWGACSRIPYFRSHPHLIISPKPRRKRLGRRKWPTELLYSTE